MTPDNTLVVPLPTGAVAGEEQAYTLSVRYVDGAGNVSPARDLDVMHDDVPPDAVYLLPGPGTVTNAANIELQVAANGATEMKIAPDATCTGGTWEPFVPFVSAPLSGLDGDKPF